MSDTLITIIAIFLIAMVLLIPIMLMAERNDDISQSVVQTELSAMVDEAAAAGEITPQNVEDFQAKIASTGTGVYSLQIEVQHLDENPGKKQDEEDTPGIAKRYSTYDPLVKMYPDGGTPQPYKLKKGDIIVATVKNEGKTLGQTFRTVFYKVTGKGTYQIYATASAMVVNSGK